MRSPLPTLDLYRRLLGVQIRSQLIYRTSFLLDTLAHCIDGSLVKSG